MFGVKVEERERGLPEPPATHSIVGTSESKICFSGTLVSPKKKIFCQKLISQKKHVPNRKSEKIRENEISVKKKISLTSA